MPDIIVLIGWWFQYKFTSSQDWWHFLINFSQCKPLFCQNIMFWIESQTSLKESAKLCSTELQWSCTTCTMRTGPPYTSKSMVCLLLFNGIKTEHSKYKNQATFLMRLFFIISFNAICSSSFQKICKIYYFTVPLGDWLEKKKFQL